MQAAETVGWRSRLAGVCCAAARRPAGTGSERAAVDSEVLGVGLPGTGSGQPSVGRAYRSTVRPENEPDQRDQHQI